MSLILFANILKTQGDRAGQFGTNYLGDRDENLITNHGFDEFFYFFDDGNLTAILYDNLKMIFMEQGSEGTMFVWSNPYILLRLPIIENHRMDLYEEATITSNPYYD